MPQTRERDEALMQLNAQLMDITTLYGQFADEFELHECKLAILHCAGHYDSGLVESLWRSIVSEGEGRCGLVCVPSISKGEGGLTEEGWVGWVVWSSMEGVWTARPPVPCTHV